MTFRWVASLVLLAGALALAGGCLLLGEGPLASPEARHLRAMKWRTTAPARVDSVGFADIVALPHVTTLAQRAALERRGVRLTGWNQRLMLAGDGDVHLELTPTPRRPGGYDTAYVTCEITPRWRARAPGWSWDRLVEAFRPTHGGATAWDGGAQQVRVTGWLMYDYAYDHVPSPWSITHGAPRLSGWEIHPVTRIERWDGARGAWAEVAR